MSTIAPPAQRRAYTFRTLSNSLISIALVDGAWHVTYVAGPDSPYAGHVSVFWAEDWSRDIQARIRFFGLTAIHGSPVHRTSPAREVSGQ